MCKFEGRIRGSVCTAPSQESVSNESFYAGEMERADGEPLFARSLDVGEDTEPFVLGSGGRHC